MAWDGADSGYGSLYEATTISSFHQIIGKFFAALIKNVVGGDIRGIRRRRLNGIVFSRG